MQSCVASEVENSGISVVAGSIVTHCSKEFDEEALTLTLGYLQPIASGDLSEKMDWVF